MSRCPALVSQALVKPAYDYVEGEVGKEFMTRLRATVQAAAPK